jgi:methyl-accepting chemotaxis protein
VALAVADALVRPLVPAEVSVLFPALEMAAAIGLLWHFMRKLLAEPGPDHGAYCTLVPDEVYDAAERCRICRAAVANAFVNRDAANARAVAELGQYPTFLYMLHAQMNSVTSLSEEAASSMLTNLSNVDEKITTLLNFIRKSQSNDSVATLTAMIESQMMNCRDTLQRLDTQQQNEIEAGSRQRARIGAETDDVLGVVERVNGIARQTMMLSFNVSIEAARAGDASKGFAVIALEIRKLASEVQILSRDMHARVQQLMRSVTVDLEDFEKQREAAEHDAIANVMRTLSELGGSLGKLTAHEREILRKVEDESEAIAGPIMDVMGSIQFQDIIRQQLGQLELMSDAVGDHIKSVGAMLESPDVKMDKATLSERLDQMYSSYVMTGQRETHAAAQGRSMEKEPVAAIELF